MSDIESQTSTRRRTWAVAAIGAAVALTGATTVAALGVFGGTDSGAAASQQPPATAEVTRATLVQTEAFDGTLGYGEASTVNAPPGGQAAGIVTWLADPGQTVSRGEPVYAVNAEPVVLFIGSMPFYRSLRPGDSGADVSQLERNLDRLGYSGFTVDGEYTDATADAVSQWQRDLGWAETGQFDPARVVVAPGRIRIAGQLAPLGSVANGALLSYTGVERVVTVELSIAQARYVAEGMAVTVTLPDAGVAEATVSRVGTVATSEDSGPGPGGGSGSTTIQVLIEVDDPAALGDWDAAPVRVSIEVDRREEVLAVPVGALLALAEGGYGVQVVNGDESYYVPVTTGMFAASLVEVSGSGIEEGTTVVIPS